LIRGVRRAPEPEECDGPPMQILALEIDHGPFEREIALNFDLQPDQVRAEQRNGLLWIYLPLRPEA
jgi:HSP20 family molecular chaperone IbpA